MNVIKTSIDGVVIIEPRLFKDARGYFFESFNQKEFEEKVCHTAFVQDNESKSSYGVVRGLHFQKPPFAQSKLVRVVQGHIESPTTTKEDLLSLSCTNAVWHTFSSNSF